MGFFDALTGKAQMDDLRKGYNSATGTLNNASMTAQKAITSGTQNANALLSNANTTLGTQNQTGQQTLQTAGNQAIGYLNPYMTSGSQANGLYSNALGLNGLLAQQDFGQNYAAFDPFRAQNANFATDALMQALNARGLSGSGYAAEAVARQNLMRGSEDYNNYLNRLFGVSQQGQNAAGTAGQFATQTAANQANLGATYAGLQNTNNLTQSGNLTNQGNTLANLIYGNGQQNANLTMGLANATAANEMTGINNLLNIAGTAASFFTPGAGGISAAGNIGKALSGGGFV